MAAVFSFQNFKKVTLSDCKATGNFSLSDIKNTNEVLLSNNKTSTSETPYIIDGCDIICAENNIHSKLPRKSMLSNMIKRVLYERQ